MTYGEVKQFLEQHTEVVELADGDARVAVCPQWVGRVMTSTCGGPDGPSFGFVNRAFIEVGRSDPRFNNFGAEERLWLSPEGGQFSLWFKPGAQQTLDNWYTAPALNEGAWQVEPGGGDSVCRMSTSMRLQNASATEFNLDVARDVKLIGPDGFAALFGHRAAEIASRSRVQAVGYETINQVTNRGAALSEATGLVSIWILGMLNAGPQTVVIVPYKPGDADELGPAIKSDYFGEVPPQRLKVTPEAVLFAADGNCRAKIGTSQRRARDVLGSVDFAGGVLTLVQFSMPDDPTDARYMNNMWGGPHDDPYTGDVANAYNDGPTASGEQLGAFYEIESLSPAVALKSGESLEHRHRTIHVHAAVDVLRQLAKEVLGIDLDAVHDAMIQGR